MICDAVRHDTKLMVGGGSRAALHGVPGYRCRAMRSDFWLACGEAFPRRTHAPLPIRPTATGKKSRLFVEDADAGHRGPSSTQSSKAADDVALIHMPACVMCLPGCHP